MLETGGPAPDFTLSAVDGTGPYMLSAAAAEAPVVLAFVPAATGPARTLFDGLAGVDWARLTARIAVFGICPDHATAANAQETPFPLLIDDRGYVADLYDVPTRPDGTPRPALVLADRDCTIRYGWVAAGHEPSVPPAGLTDAVSRLAD